MSVTERDYELISAYIDGELTAAEQAEVEARLQNDPEWQRELKSLQQTVALIQQLPPRTAPRNFTLDARKFSKPALPFPLTMTFSALSTAAAVLLFVFGGYFLLQADIRPQSASSPPQQQATQVEAVAAAPSPTALSTQAPPPATLAPQGTPIAETEIQAQMPQAADRERDETGEEAASEPLADDAGTIGLFSTDENAQAPSSSEALAESRAQTEAQTAFGETTATVALGGGAMATAAAPAIVRPVPTAVAALKASDVPEDGFRAIPPAEENAVPEISMNGAGADLTDSGNEGAEGRLDDNLMRQEAMVTDDSRGIIGAGLLAAGVILLVTGLLTTLARQRRLRA